MNYSSRKFLSLAAIIFITLVTTKATLAGSAGEVLWKFDLSNVSGAFVTVGANGTIYTVDSNNLWALNPDGTVKWTFKSGGGQPVDILPDGNLVMASAHTIWKLNTDGNILWSFSWDGGYYNQIDNGPGVGPDGNIYATTAINDGLGMGAFSLTDDGQLRWQDDPTPSMFILNASHHQRVRFTDSRMVFGFINTTGPPDVHAYSFDGDHTNYIDFTCTSSPNTDSQFLYMAGVCGTQEIDLSNASIEWSVDFGAVNMPPIIGSDGTVYSGSWHGPVGAISAQGQLLWTSQNVGLQRTLAVSQKHGLFLYAGETFGSPNWLGALDIASGQVMWEIPFDTVDDHNELSWSNEAAFSPDGSVAYFTTRFTSNGTSGRLYAVRIGEASLCQWDLDGSGMVGTGDLLELFAQWGTSGPADFDGSGAVGTSDLLILFANWGPCP